MKTLLKLLVLVLLTNVSFAQDIPLKPFVLEVPTVNKLSVKGLDHKMGYVDFVKNELITPDSSVVDSVTKQTTSYFNGQIITKSEYEYVYYKLLRADGRVVEEGNKYIPIQMWNNIGNYVRGTVTPSVVNTINHFFVLADWANLEAILPEEQE